MLLCAVAFQTRQVPLVLLVEDHSDTRAMYAEFLSDWFDIVQASDASEALRLMGEQVPDLVITDVSLPGMDGFQLLEQIRRTANLENVPVICLSGFGGTAHEQRAKEAGCDALLVKPCLPDTLAERATDLLRQRERKEDR